MRKTYAALSFIRGGDARDLQEADLAKTVALIVEDEIVIAEGLRCTLEAMGCEVLGPAPNCSAAIEVLWSRRPDVVFVDTQLGTENCEVVVEECDYQNIPVVITTG